MNSKAASLSVVLCLLSLTALRPSPAGALDITGFLPGQGVGTLGVSYTGEGYDEFWVGETKVSDPGVGEVDIVSLALWFDWGFTDDLALVGNVAHVDADSDGLGGFEDSGLQDLSVLLKYRFLSSGPHSLVGAAGVRTPLSDYEANLPVDLGDGTTDALARLVYLFNPGAFYFSQQVGYDMRGDDAPDGIPIYTELGYTTGNLTFIGFYSQLTADGGTDIGDPGFTFPSNKDEYSRAGVKLYNRLGERYGFSILGFTTLDGRNSGDAQGVSVGTTVRF
ncbi:MAG TPA: hypothetical protein VF179_29850 [Thermoanaerobaculia bacterium]|nr:hypothetical protein [Thermoanaerobaculia bacterium]